MWCANCQADVAAEVTADTRRIRCATCGATIDSVHTSRASARTREARELLERWSSGSLLDPFASLSTSADDESAKSGGLRSDEASSAPVPMAPEAPVAAAPAPAQPAKRVFRIDKSHQPGERGLRSASTAMQDHQAAAAAKSSAAAAIPEAPPRPEDILRSKLVQAAPAEIPAAAAAMPEIESEISSAIPSEPYRQPALSGRSAAAGSYADEPEDDYEPPRRSERRRRYRSHAAHAPSPPAPHFDIQELAQKQEPRKPNATSVTGQMLAYSGVLGLTIGTAMVVWGYFGGPENFAPTGWLITTAGQMLLFLGVVTLVSGGMEQTTDEVARRIDHLGDKLIRIEQASRDHALRGPSIPAERFAADAPPAPTRSSGARTPSA